MQLEVGKIYEGKVTGITKFGAFVEFDKDTVGMVHISEVANAFVSEIKHFIQEGQMVKAKVMNVTDDGKISLSIKKALPASERRTKPNGGRYASKGSLGRRHYRPDTETQDFMKNPPPVFDTGTGSGNSDFEDMLSKFKATSEERFSDLKHVIDNKRKSPSRRK